MIEQPHFDSYSTPARICFGFAIFCVALLVVASPTVLAAAGDPTIPSRLNDTSFWTAYEGNLDDGVQQIQGTGSGPGSANTAMAANCPKASRGQWVYSCTALTCGAITSASVSTQCTHQRTETNTFTGYTVSPTITSSALKTVVQRYDCGFDEGRSDLVGQVCKCRSGYVANIWR